MHPKFDQTSVRAHDLQIMDSAFHVPMMIALTTETRGTLSYRDALLFCLLSDFRACESLVDCNKLAFCNEEKLCECNEGYEGDGKQNCTGMYECNM